MVAEPDATGARDADRAPSRRIGRPPGPTPDRAERREELLDAAVAAIAQHGPTASMQQIADASGFSRPIFYDHFTDRAGLADAVLGRYASVFSGHIEQGFAAEQSLIDAVVAGFDAFCDFAEHNENLYRFLRIAATSAPAESALDDVAGAHLGELVSAHLAERGLDPAMGETWGRGLLAMALGTSEWWLATRAIPRESLTEQLRSFLELGLSDR
jgi:AcrR family transcriptional regulator